jgi:hypothetical protein
MKRNTARLFLAFVITLSGCQSLTPQSAEWTRSEIEQSFDLSELGTLNYDAQGHLRIGEKRLPEALANLRPYGRQFNFLRLDDATLNALDPSVAIALTHASPTQLRERMATYGLTLRDLEVAWHDGEVRLEEFRSVVRVSQQRMGTASLQTALNVPAFWEK